MNILKVFGWITLFLFAGSLQAKKIEIIDIRCENQECPMGVQTLKPTFSWKLLGDARNLTQVGYRILVSDNEDLLKKDIGNIWDSGRCNSEISINCLEEKSCCRLHVIIGKYKYGITKESSRNGRK